VPPFKIANAKKALAILGYAQEIEADLEANPDAFPRFLVGSMRATFAFYMNDTQPDRQEIHGVILEPKEHDMRIVYKGVRSRICCRFIVYKEKEIERLNEYKLCNESGDKTLVIPYGPDDALWIIDVWPDDVEGPPTRASDKPFDQNVRLKIGESIVPFDGRCLADASPDYFGVMFVSPMFDFKRAIVIEFSESAANAMIRFLRHKGIFHNISDNDLAELTTLADRYDIPSLLKKCESYVIDRICKGTVVPFLRLADHIRLEFVRMFLLIKISGNKKLQSFLLDSSRDQIAKFFEQKDLIPAESSMTATGLSTAALLAAENDTKERSLTKLKRKRVISVRDTK
jgi:hypothetical protein